MHKKLFSLFLILFAFLHVFYLHADLSKARDESWKLMLEKAEKMKYENPAEAVKYIKAALEDAGRSQSKDDLLDIKILLGNAYLRISQFKTAEKVYLDALKEAEKYGKYSQQNRLYNNLGLVNKYLGKYESALEYYQKSVEVSKQLRDEVAEGESLQNIGTMYYELDKIDLAERYFIQALGLFERHKNKTGMSGIYTNLGILSHDSGDLVTAKKYYESSLSIDEELNNFDGVATNYNNLAAIYRSEKNYEQAFNYYTMALAIAMKSEDIESVAMFKKNISALLMIKGQYEDDEKYLNEAESMLNEALESITEIDLQYEKLELYSALSNLYDVKAEHYQLHKNYLKKLQSLENAIIYRDKYIQLSDSLFTNESEQSINELEVKYETAKKQRELEHEIKSSRIRTIFFFIIAFLILLLLFLTYSRYRLKSIHNNDLLEKNKLITRQKEELTFKNEEISISNDILKDKHNLLTRILQNVPNPLFYTNSDHRIIGYNNKLLELLEVSTGDAGEMKTEDIFSMLGLKFSVDCDRIERSYSVEYVNSKRALQYFMVHVSCYEDHNSEYAGDIVLLQNITDIRNTEIALKSSEKNLIELNAAKDRLFSIIAHDLKNPLGVLLLSAEMVEKHYDKFDKEKITSMVGQIHRGIRHVLNLLQNLLQWAKTQTGSIKFRAEAVSITDLFKDLVPLVLIQSEKKGIDFSIALPEEIQVYVDCNMMKTVFLNMMTNAVKFTEKGGQVSINYKQEDDFHVISISDTGIGMTNEQVSKLYRIDENVVRAGTENEQGSGLGFLLSKELVSIHRGCIEVISEPGSGTKVNIRIPKQNNEV